MGSFAKFSCVLKEVRWMFAGLTLLYSLTPALQGASGLYFWYNSNYRKILRWPKPTYACWLCFLITN